MDSKMNLTQLHGEIIIIGLRLLKDHIKDYTQDEFQCNMTIRTADVCVEKMGTRQVKFSAEEMRVLTFASEIMKRFYLNDEEILSKIKATDDLDRYKQAIYDLHVHLHSIYDMIRAKRTPKA